MPTRLARSTGPGCFANMIYTDTENLLQGAHRPLIIIAIYRKFHRAQQCFIEPTPYEMPIS